jgi:hypothetical protein
LFVDWGKRRNVIRERQDLVAVATLRPRQAEGDVRQRAVKPSRARPANRLATAWAGERG